MPRPLIVPATLLFAALFALAVVHVRAADDVAEQGTLLRESALVALPGGAAVASLAAGTTVDVHGRQGLWLLVTAPTASGVQRGWTR
ncbi:MAG: hypothetical protein RLW62_18140, partial [Gammaproteobacteria bacterium]